jgi:Ca2+/Na+ antiporter
MTRVRKTIFIVSEFIFGAGFGFLGVYVFALFDKGDLFASVLYGSIIGLTCSLMGIGLVGYFYLKQIDRLNDFRESVLLSFFGLSIFLILAFIMSSLNLIPHSSGLFLILPLVGAVIGFNYKSRQTAKEGLNKK